MAAASDRAPPSTAGIALATGIVCALGGYFIGQASSIGIFGSSKKPKNSKGSRGSKKSWPNSYDVNIHPDSSDEELMESLGRPKKKKTEGTIPDSEDEDYEDSDEEPEDGEEEDENEFGGKGDFLGFEAVEGECKMILVVRTDLGMTKGKIAAQAAHAALACYTALLHSSPSPNLKHPILERWMKSGQAKVAVQCKSEEELLTLQAKALSLGICARVIRDAGRTQIAAGSATVLGIGPAPKAVVDEVTGSLKLL